MRRTICKVLLAALIAVSAFAFAACEQADEPRALPVQVLNGGFETADLSGWTVESGEAFKDDSVSSRKTFSVSYDSAHKQIRAVFAPTILY